MQLLSAALFPSPPTPFLAPGRHFPECATSQELPSSPTFLVMRRWELRLCPIRYDTARDELSFRPIAPVIPLLEYCVYYETHAYVRGPGYPDLRGNGFRARTIRVAKGQLRIRPSRPRQLPHRQEL